MCQVKCVHLTQHSGWYLKNKKSVHEFTTATLLNNRTIETVDGQFEACSQWHAGTKLWVYTASIYINWFICYIVIVLKRFWQSVVTRQLLVQLGLESLFINWIWSFFVLKIFALLKKNQLNGRSDRYFFHSEITCLHEEADTWMFVHLKHAIEKDFVKAACMPIIQVLS